MKLRTSLLLFWMFCSLALIAQGPPVSSQGPSGKSKKQKDPLVKAKSDTITPCFALSFSYGLQLPGGDLVHRFGVNSTAGIALSYKTRKNILYSAQWSYMFGKDLRGDNPLAGISTSDGHVIDREGKYSDIRMFERGYTLGLSAGKIFNSFLSNNKNSGILLSGGIGFLQHKIKIYDNGARTPQLSKEMLKGYDRMTSGFMFTEFVGYFYLSRNRYVNFYSGFEFYQAFTKSRRSWDYTLMRADTEQRLDLLSGFRIGWVLPLYKAPVRTKYYY